MTTAVSQVPLVDYLVVGNDPHLVAHECVDCGATFFDRRNGCGKCGGSTFHDVPVGREGIVTTFTIVSFAAPGIDVPFVSAVVDCEGTAVRANLVNVTPDPKQVSTGMRVRLTTFAIGIDSQGAEVVGFGFRPVAS